MATRFIKPKIDKYIQLYSKYAKQDGQLYSSVININITNPGDIIYTIAPILTLTVPPTGVTSTAILNLISGVPTSVTITNSGFGYITAPLVSLSGGTILSGTVQATIISIINLDKKREFVWDLDGSIELNENGLIQIVERQFINASSTTVYIIKILDISTQSVINTKDSSGIPGQAQLTQGKILDIGVPIKPFISDIKLEVQPQTISKISMIIDDGISNNTGINGAIEFFISLKITEKEPSIIEYGSLNNINIHQ
jgi:hypothetical protein